MKAILCKEGFYVVIKCHKHGSHIVQSERWHYNKDAEKPTLSPSVREFTVGESGNQTVCHFTVTGGKIQYHDDCPHEFSGQTIDLLDFTPEEATYFTTTEGYR